MCVCVCGCLSSRISFYKLKRFSQHLKIIKIKKHSYKNIWEFNGKITEKANELVNYAKVEYLHYRTYQYIKT